MTTTRQSLLVRVRDWKDQEAWERFYGLYAPLLVRYARSRGLDADAAEEIRDQCLEIIARRMPHFRYDRAVGRFQSWLYRIVSAKVIDRQRAARRAAKEIPEGIADSAPTPEEEWDRRWRYQHLQYCLEQVRSDVSEKPYQAFRMLLDEELSVEDVAQRLQITKNQVYKAKSMVLKRIRAKLKDLEARGP